MEFYGWFQLHDLLNEQVPNHDVHDFNIISQTGCDYDDNGKGLQ